MCSEVEQITLPNSVGEWWIVWKTGADGSITIQLIKETGW
jgi:hypothetical protein